jgi:hypothetical protein
MKTKLFVCAALIAAIAVATDRAQSSGGALPAPGFHHLHLNSINPEAAIEFAQVAQQRLGALHEG